jgi:hypothetical protein
MLALFGGESKGILAAMGWVQAATRRRSVGWGDKALGHAFILRPLSILGVRQIWEPAAGRITRFVIVETVSL